MMDDDEIKKDQVKIEDNLQEFSIFQMKTKQLK